MKTTPNFCIEKISNEEKKTPGGIYRAFKDKVEVFAYLFYKDRKAYFWDVPVLMEEVEKYVSSKKSRVIGVENNYDNQIYWTLNYLIPRKSLEGFCYRTEVINKKYF
jgi:hypothetical protein